MTKNSLRKSGGKIWHEKSAGQLSSKWIGWSGRANRWGTCVRQRSVRPWTGLPSEGLSTRVRVLYNHTVSCKVWFSRSVLPRQDYATESTSAAQRVNRVARVVTPGDPNGIGRCKSLRICVQKEVLGARCCCKNLVQVGPMRCHVFVQ